MIYYSLSRLEGAGTQQFHAIFSFKNRSEFAHDLCDLLLFMFFTW